MKLRKRIQIIIIHVFNLKIIYIANTKLLKSENLKLYTKKNKNKERFIHN